MCVLACLHCFLPVFVFGSLLFFFRCIALFLQSTLSEESKEAYNLLIGKMETTGIHQQQQQQQQAATGEAEESNPLRMLRSGGLTVVRPKIRGNKHQLASKETRDAKVV